MNENQSNFVPNPRRRTFVCHMVIEVEVMTAKRCPVREILRASSGSVSADLENEASRLDNRVERFCSEACSTGLMPGVIGVEGIGIDDWSSSCSLSSATALGASTRDPLPSVVSRDSASSSNSKMRSLAALMLLAAYIRGAPMGQYMAARCQNSSFVGSHAREVAHQSCRREFGHLKHGELRDQVLRLRRQGCSPVSIRSRGWVGFIPENIVQSEDRITSEEYILLAVPSLILLASLLLLFIPLFDPITETYIYNYQTLVRDILDFMATVSTKFSKLEFLSNCHTPNIYPLNEAQSTRLIQPLRL